MLTLPRSDGVRGKRERERERERERGFFVLSVQRESLFLLQQTDVAVLAWWMDVGSTS
jgi:hypothetical protein